MQLIEVTAGYLLLLLLRMLISRCELRKRDPGLLLMQIPPRGNSPISSSCPMLSLLHTSFVRHCHTSRLGKSFILHTLEVNICRQSEPSAHEPSRLSVRPQTTTSIHSLSHSLLATGFGLASLLKHEDQVSQHALLDGQNDWTEQVSDRPVETRRRNTAYTHCDVTF